MKTTTAFAFLSIVLSYAPVSCAGTIVRFETVLGNIDVELYDAATPLTVANFLNYVNDGDYDDSFIHRSVPEFVIQGGSFSFDDSTGIANFSVDPPVLNEPGISNIRGTIAMAKLAGDPNSATSSWFFNLEDNSANLDFQNGGFAVFGEVLGNGMDVVDAIAGLQIIDAGGAFSALPVRNYSGGNIFDEHLVNLKSVFVVPEPTTLTLATLALLGMSYRRHNRT